MVQLHALLVLMHLVNQLQVPVFADIHIQLIWLLTHGHIQVYKHLVAKCMILVKYGVLLFGI